jgi:GNAT superfamily N-acetyltransferase
MQLDGSALDAGVLVDLAVSPEHRSLGPAMMLQSALAEIGAARFGLLYGFPNPKAAPVFKRVGYAKLGEIVRHARVLRHADYLSRRMPRALACIAGPLVDLGMRVRDAWRSRGDARFLVLWSDAADPRFDALWARSSTVNVALSIRDYAFAHWRFDQCPFEKTQFLLLSDPGNGNLLAWFACQVKDNTLHVRDFWSAEAACGLAREYVDALLAEVRKLGCAAVSFEIAGATRRLEGWRMAGFSARGKRPVFGKWGDAHAKVSIDLYLTSADEDE